MHWASLKLHTVSAGASDAAATLNLLPSTERPDLALEEIVKFERRVGQEIRVCRDGDGFFPNSLKRLVKQDRPSEIFALGNLNLLEKSSAGICGSRHATERGLSIAQQTVEILAGSGIVIVSGYAAGVDASAHKAALQASSGTIVVLAEGILNFSIRRELRPLWDWNKVLVLSQFKMKAKWQAWNAMRRNRTIVGLSDVMLVVEARGTGGTLDAGKATLEYNKPLFVIDYTTIDEYTQGNELLIQRGGIPLKRNRTSGQPSVRSILDNIGQRENGVDCIAHP
jgi:DNA processing protein